MDTYIIKLKKELYRRLPSTTEYRASKRIEGWMDSREETAAHKYVTIFVDDELQQAEYDQMIDGIRNFLKRDTYFRQSHYMIYLWKQDNLMNMTPGNLSSTRIHNGDFGMFQVNGSGSSDWSKFLDLYMPHRRAGQVILLTTKDKIEKLRVQKLPRIKNLLIVYRGDSNSKPVETISGNVCIACVEKETKDENAEIDN